VVGGKQLESFDITCGLCAINVVEDGLTIHSDS
jgi:hypothetical protein